MASPSARVAQFVASALGLKKDQVTINGDGQPQISGPSGAPIAGLQSVCECLASASTSAGTLLAQQDPAAAAQVRKCC